MLNIYDSRDTFYCPKYQLLTRDIRIDPLDSMKSSGKRMECFTVFSLSRKVFEFEV